MPQFSWKGIGLNGLDQSGVLTARSHKQLEALLFSQDVALLSSSVVRPYSRLRPIGVSVKTAFFDQLATLLEAGVFLDTALQILYEQTDNNSFKKVLADIGFSVQEGSQLHEAVGVYPELFDEVIVTVIQSGQEAGSLPITLRSIANYLTSRQQFATTIRRVSMLPAITCTFFLLIAGIIIGFIVPSFASLYQSAGKQLPQTTQTLLWLSSWFSISGLLLSVPLFGALYGAWRYGKRSDSIANTYEAIILRLPIVGHLIWYGSALAYMQALAILTAGGVHVVPALKFALGALHTKRLKNIFSKVHTEVDHGSLVSHSLARHAGQFCSPSVIALVRVGEESGRLDCAFGQVAKVYQQRLEGTSSLVTTLVQPLLMIVLGLMITGLIFAVYVPIFNLSSVVS